MQKNTFQNSPDSPLLEILWVSPFTHPRCASAFLRPTRGRGGQQTALPQSPPQGSMTQRPPVWPPTWEGTSPGVGVPLSSGRIVSLLWNG